MYSLGVATHRHPTNLHLKSAKIFTHIYLYFYIRVWKVNDILGCVSLLNDCMLYDIVSPRTSLSITRKVFINFLSIKSYRKKKYVLWILKYSLIGVGVFPFPEAIPHGRRYEKAMSGLSCIVVDGGAIHYGLTRLWLWTMRCDVMRGGLR